MKLSNQTYNLLKYICLVGLPAVATFIAAFGAIWNLPHTDEIMKTVVAFNVLLSALVVVKGVQYNNSDVRFDGVAVVQETPEGQDNVITDLNLHKTAEEVSNQDELRLKVNKLPLAG